MFLTDMSYILMEKSIISRSAKDTALGSMMERSLGYSMAITKENTMASFTIFKRTLNLPFSFNWPAINIDY